MATTDYGNGGRKRVSFVAGLLVGEILKTLRRLVLAIITLSSAGLALATIVFALDGQWVYSALCFVAMLALDILYRSLHD